MPAIVCPRCDDAFSEPTLFEAHMEAEHPSPARLLYGHRA